MVDIALDRLEFPPTWVERDLQQRAARRPAAPLFDDDEDGAPPVELRDEALDRWHGRLYHRRASGEVDRSWSLWALACALLEAGLKTRFVVELIADRDVALGWEKFAGRRDAAERYRLIVERARAGLGPKRIRLGQGSVATAAATKGRLRAEWHTAASLDAIEDEEVSWFAYGMLGAGLITELDGKVKQSGKTTLALAMMFAILNGETFLGRATTYSPVVYLTEQSGPSFKRNLERAGLLGRDDFHILLWSRITGWKWPDVVYEVVTRIAEVGAAVLVVDTLGQFSGVRGDDENRSGSAMNIMEPLQAAAAGKLAILLSRHDRKSGGEVGDSGRGSSAYAGAVDIILHLQRTGEAKPGQERQRVIEGISRFEETPGKLLVELSDREPYHYDALGDADELRDEQLGIEILRWLPTTAADAIETKQLKENVAVRAVDLGRALWGLMRSGQAIRLGKGRKGDPYRYYQRVYDDDD